VARATSRAEEGRLGVAVWSRRAGSPASPNITAAGARPDGAERLRRSGPGSPDGGLGLVEAPAPSHVLGPLTGEEEGDLGGGSDGRSVRTSGTASRRPTSPARPGRSLRSPPPAPAAAGDGPGRVGGVADVAHAWSDGREMGGVAAASAWRPRGLRERVRRWAGRSAAAGAGRGGGLLPPPGGRWCARSEGTD